MNYGENWEMKQSFRDAPRMQIRDSVITIVDTLSLKSITKSFAVFEWMYQEK